MVIELTSPEVDFLILADKAEATEISATQPNRLK